MSGCAVIWCSNNCAGQCLIDPCDETVYHDEIRCCPMCDVFLKEGLVLDIPEEAGADIGDFVEDCGLEYAVDDPRAKTLVLRKMGDSPGDWVAIRARPEDADRLRVFPHVDGYLACEHVLPGQQELELGV